MSLKKQERRFVTGVLPFWGRCWAELWGCGGEKQTGAGQHPV